VALYGLGNQEKYPERFANGLGQLYGMVVATGATIVGEWSTEGYSFEQSQAAAGGRFVGLVIDNNSQAHLTEERLDRWVATVAPLLLEPATAA
jgi:flavodoxin I